MITQTRLMELFTYNPDTGNFIRNTSIGPYKSGSIAGSLKRDGYVRIVADKINYAAHRLAWLYMYGYIPEKDIDHINRIRNDNRITNLRPVTRSENSRNQNMRPTNTSGFAGVTFQKSCNKWQAQIQYLGEKVYLGVYNTAEEAHEAYLEAAEVLDIV